MSTVSTFVFTAGSTLGALCELARYAFRSGWVTLPLSGGRETDTGCCVRARD